MGYATIHLDKYDEDYLVPLPNVKVSGLISGTPYPEITGTYSIVSSNGYIADIDFSGKKLLGLTGTKNSFSASVYDSKDGSKKVLYTAEGTWSEGFKIRDEVNDAEVESYDYNTANLPAIQTEPLDKQDPWESQRAWYDTTTALDRGDMQGAADAKSKIEEGQRAMRAEEEKKGEKWQTIFFKNEREDPVYTKLAAGLDTGDDLSREFGFWKYQYVGKDLPSRPYRGDLTPENTRTGGEGAVSARQGEEEALAGAGAATAGTAATAGVTSQGSRSQRVTATPSSPSDQQFAVPRKPVGADASTRETSETAPKTTSPHDPTKKMKAQPQTSQQEKTSPYSVRQLDPRVR